MANRKDKTNGSDEKDEKKEKQQQKTLEPPRPIRMEVDVVGEDGQYSFGIQVISDKGVGIKSRIRILEGNKVSSTQETGPDGFLEHKATNFKDEEMDFKFRVISSDIDWQITLPGPKQEKEDKKPKEKIKVISGGFWVNVKNALTVNKKNKE